MLTIGPVHDYSRASVLYGLRAEVADAADTAGRYTHLKDGEGTEDRVGRVSRTPSEVVLLVRGVHRLVVAPMGSN